MLGEEDIAAKDARHEVCAAFHKEFSCCSVALITLFESGAGVLTG